MYHQLKQSTGTTTGTTNCASAHLVSTALLANADGTYTDADRELVLDCGATMHLTGNPNILFKLEKSKRTVTLVLADGHHITVNTFGRIMINSNVFITNVGYVKGMRTTLVSLAVLVRAGFEFDFSTTGAEMVTPKGKGVKYGGLVAASWKAAGNLYIAKLPRNKLYGFDRTYWSTNADSFNVQLWYKIHSGDTGEPPVPPDAPATPANSEAEFKEELKRKQKNMKGKKTAAVITIDDTGAPPVPPVTSDATPTATSTATANKRKSLFKKTNKTVTIAGTTNLPLATSRSPPPASTPAPPSILSTPTVNANYVLHHHNKNKE